MHEHDILDYDGMGNWGRFPAQDMSNQPVKKPSLLVRVRKILMGLIHSVHRTYSK